MIPIKPPKISKVFEIDRRRREEPSTDIDEFRDEQNEDDAIVARVQRSQVRIYDPAVIRRKKINGWLLNLFFLLIAPAIAAVYLYGIATDMYKVDTVLMIKAPLTGSNMGGAGAMTTMLGSQTSTMTRAIDESFAVVEYITSREAFRELQEKVNFAEHFKNPDADYFSRLEPDADFEAAYSYYTDHIDVRYDDVTGQIILTTYGFEAETAADIAQAVIELSENVVNSFNQRSERDFLAHVEDQVDKAKTELRRVEEEVTQFRLTERLIDPSSDSSARESIITQLLTQSASIQAEITNLASRGISSEQQIQPLRNRLAAIEEQVTRERSSLTGENSPLAPVLARYQFLIVEQTIAQQQYTAALNNLSNAQFQAGAQKLYVLTVVPPRLPEQAQLPARQWNMFLTFLFSLFGLIVLRVIIASVRDHMV